ncbi:MAG: thiamine pyrophosphate-binding protein [Gammaproteobacteria bacterium]|nr:thiamine pyrophosphate-binding protein [Gammaproteobacteria bacterium]
MRTGAEILLDGLVGYGVDTIFCVPGESYLAALDATYDRKNNLRVITCRQEGGVAYMTEAYGKLTGKPGVCFVSRGPGASNAMIGVHTAAQDSTPMLVFVGHIPRCDVGREAFQALDYHQVYSSIAKRVITFNDVERIPEQLQQAWSVATSGRGGPVVVELPEDMLLDKSDVANLPAPNVTVAGPSPDALNQLFEVLDQSQRPVILCGGAGWTPKASELLTRFSEQQVIPVATAFRRSDSFDNLHPNYAGDLGINPNPELVRLMQNSDLIITIAARLGDVTTSGYEIFDVPDGISKRDDQKLVHVFINGEELNSVYHADLGIVSHPELFLQLACHHEKNQNPAHQDLRRRGVEKAHQDYRAFFAQPCDPDNNLRMFDVMGVIRKHVDNDTILTCGAGLYTVFFQRYYQFRQPGTQLASTNGSMGYSVPAAISAKLQKPQSTVLCFAGDGCFLMNGQELATAVQYKLNVIFLVVNNSVYGTIKSYQERQFPDRIVATDLQNPNFAVLAEAYGAFGGVVEKTEEFEPVFKEALCCGKPAVIELRVEYF